MAKIEKLKSGRWRALVRKAGHPAKSSTFDKKMQAEAWAAKIETEINESKSQGVVYGKTVNDMFNRYLAEVSVRKKGYRWELLRINAWQRDMPAFCAKLLSKVTKADFSAWKTARMATVQEATVAREWTLLRAIVRTAWKDWGWISVNPTDGIPSPKDNMPRYRRVSGEEKQAVLAALGDDYLTVRGRASLAFRFALVLPVRVSEICRLKWDDVKLGSHPSFLINEAKNGKSREVPLFGDALEVVKTLKQFKDDTDSVFHLRPGSLDTVFRETLKKTSIKDLHFNDTRHEAYSVLAGKIDPMTLGKIGGTEDVKLLMRVYYNPTIKDLHDKLAK